MTHVGILQVSGLWLRVLFFQLFLSLVKFSTKERHQSPFGQCFVSKPTTRKSSPRLAAGAQAVHGLKAEILPLPLSWHLRLYGTHLPGCAGALFDMNEEKNKSLWSHLFWKSLQVTLTLITEMNKALERKRIFLTGMYIFQITTALCYINTRSCEERYA